MEPVTQAAAVAAHIPHDMSILGLVEQAGLFVKFIMLLLVAMSVVTWAILFAKHGVFRSLKKKADRFEEAFWGNQGLEELYKNATPEDTDHPMAKLYVVGLRELEDIDNKPGASDDTVLRVGRVDRIRQLMIAKMNRDLEKLEQMLPLLATIGSTAPFIGLLGTVWGIMISFQSIGATNNTSLAVVAPGIAEALLATALGLFAAIPAVVAYNKLSTELGRYAVRLEAFVAEFCTLMESTRERARKAQKGK